MKKIVDATMLEYKSLSQVTYSPDGKTIAFVSRVADYAANCYRKDIYVVREDKETYQLTYTGDVACYTWTPDNKIAYVGKGPALYLIDPQGGDPAMLCVFDSKAVSKLGYVEGGCFRFVGEYRLPKPVDPHLTPLPDREAVYYTFDELPTMKENKGTQSGKRNVLCLIDPASGKVEKISDPACSVVNVTGDDKTIVYTEVAYNANGVREEDVSIFTYDVADGNKVKVMDRSELMYRTCEVFAHLWGDRILVFGSKGDRYGYVQSPDAWVIDRKTLKMTRLFEFNDYGTNVAYRNALTDLDSPGGMMKVVDGKVWFTNTRDHYTYLRWFGDDGKWSGDYTPDGDCDGFDIHGDSIVYSGFYGDRLCEIYENGVQLTRMNERIQEEYTISTPEYLSYVNSEGYRIDGWVMKPIGYEPGKKYPVILDIHGGPRCNFGELFFHEHQVWANDGYFCFFCNPRGGEGRDDDFADCWGPKMGDVDYRDIMDFVDVALKAYPDADEKKMGVMGGSFGGYMTNWIIGHTDRFAAACSQRSISNWTSFEHATGGIGYYWSKNFMLARTVENAEYLWDRSPLKYAPNAKTPTLFINSNQDNVCWQDQGIQMFTALKLAGTPAKMCFFRHEGHELSRSGSPVPRLARLKEIHAWMDRYLK